MSTGRHELWVEEPVGRRRLPDPVRIVAVRAGIVTSVALIQAMAAYLLTVTGSWLAFPLVLTSIGSTVGATWAVLDVWVTRQVWKQRYGVVSEPSSTARQLRRERRLAKRAAREAARIRTAPARTAARGAQAPPGGHAPQPAPGELSRA
ncbi:MULTISPECIES: hypothetical protein [Streptomyces]|uniref:Uncharacterized protein n=2 Tax=Streptomyces TaxID=1883 RepID=A0A100Y125_9ACTN|nr:hypothetical protein [Streptomyces kanasensis]KUH35744.1 hypothetical protein ATE80_27485 [Streptomyces kanasensis]UUS30050.1 hypothetical protein NRO40_03845 [Streptomyces changanensis]